MNSLINDEGYCPVNVVFEKKNKKSMCAFHPTLSYSLMLCLLLDETEWAIEWFHHSHTD